MLPAGSSYKKNFVNFFVNQIKGVSILKLIFAGTPAFAVEPLCAILDAGHEVTAVLTQPDKPQGRKGVLTPSPVKEEAMRRGIPVFQPVKLREEVAALAAYGAEAMVTCAYGQILTQDVLDRFPKGVWNIHASLLPAYRGAAPIARALIDGCRETGVTIMKTELGLDTGDMLLSARCPIYDSDDCGTLEDRLSRLSAPLIVEALSRVERGAYSLTKQGEGFVCKKVAHTEVDFSRPAREVSCLIRGLSPAPLAYGRVGEMTLNFFFAEACDGADAPCGTVVAASAKEGLIIACGEGAVRVLELQPAGGRRMSARDFLNGRKLAKGMRFEPLS